MKIKIWNRQKKEYIEEEQYYSKLLKFLYHTFLGRSILKGLCIRRWFSRIVGSYYYSRFSCHKIKKFIKKYDICLEDYEENEFHNFNEFFSRKLKEGKRKIAYGKKDLISPCDSKLLYYPIDERLKLRIKNSSYSIQDLIEDAKLAKEYQNGHCLIFRLTLDDYHRYIYMDQGNVLNQKRIKGVLHTVTSVSENEKIYSTNSREVTVLQTENFEKVIQIEVGALLVGKIKNLEKQSFLKGEEKGYFQLGGSTIILLLKNGIVKIDEDIIKNSNDHIETKVALGEKIGSRIRY